MLLAGTPARTPPLRLLLCAWPRHPRQPLLLLYSCSCLSRINPPSLLAACLQTWFDSSYPLELENAAIGFAMSRARPSTKVLIGAPVAGTRSPLQAAQQAIVSATNTRGRTRLTGLFISPPRGGATDLFSIRRGQIFFWAQVTSRSVRRQRVAGRGGSDRWARGRIVRAAGACRYRP